MQNSTKLIKVGAATAAIAAVGVAGLATAPAASADIVIVSKNTSSKTPKILPVVERTLKKGQKSTITGGRVVMTKGTVFVGKRISVKRTGAAKWTAINKRYVKVGVGRWTVRTELFYKTKSNPKVVKKVYLTNRFTAAAKKVVKPAAKISSSRLGVWNKVAKCESGGNWKISTGNGYYGGLQFSASTWRAYGGGKYASTANRATKAQQITIAEKVVKGQGPGAWPHCGRKAGLTRI